MAKKTLRKGLFITFEGSEGCGKSTHARLLYNYLKRRGYECVHTREPGGTKVGDWIRHILLHSNALFISDLAELFLFEAARSQIVKEVIIPNLSKNRVVICDRFSDATLAYQGYGGGVSLRLIDELNTIAAKGLKPDLTIVLDVAVKTGLGRAKKKGVDRMESKAMAYHKRVRAGYLKLTKQEPKRIKVIKVDKPIAVTQNKIREIVKTICHLAI